MPEISRGSRGAGWDTIDQDPSVHYPWLPPMAKRSTQARRRKKNRAVQPRDLSSSQLLQSFKVSWKNGEWAEALVRYRTWTARTGAKRQALIEGELLFRAASYHFRNGNLRAARELLEEARQKDPEREARCLRYLGICLARMGDYEASIDVYSRQSDSFHREILGHLGERGKRLPESSPGDLAFEQSMLLRFWKELEADETVSTPSTALQSIANAYRRFVAAEDPEPQLRLLCGKPGFGSIALYLLLLNAVRGRSTIKIRNLIEKNSGAFEGSSFTRLLDIHLLCLLGEENHQEVSTLTAILREHHIDTGRLPEVLDELSFRLGLQEIELNHWEKALDHLLRVKQASPSLLHNTALLYRNLGHFREANKYWLRLHQRVPRPKRSDPEDVRLAYISTLRHIAGNYLKAYELEDASSCFKDILSLDRNDREALDHLQSITGDLGDHEEACRYARRLYELDPENEEYLASYILTLVPLGRLESAIPLYRRGIEKRPEDPFYREGLTDALIRSAWPLRRTDPQQARALVRQVKELDQDMAELHYLEGFFLKEEGKRKAALRLFELAVDVAGDHWIQSRLGIAFYQDGMPDRALAIFRDIVTCACPLSTMVFDRCLGFLVEQNDAEQAVALCDTALGTGVYDLFSVADDLLDYRKPEWAVRYSSMLTRGEDADEDDRVLHLLILNELGDQETTLAQAQALQEEAAEADDFEAVQLYRYLIKQIKKKGRFKVPDE